ncbi:hypothetical protein HY839_04760 [Candidatus Azambacteria bacterium]|nr:hypothetical protein [Candidatus Azambacteria bacterium]
MRTFSTLCIIVVAALCGCPSNQEVVAPVADTSADTTSDIAYPDVLGVDYAKPCTSATAASVCDDHSVCTMDSCYINQSKEGSGFCQHLPVDTIDIQCNDGNACTVSDTCVNGKCVGGGLKVCDDKNPCTDDSCDTASGMCSSKNNTAACDDGNACTVEDVCKNGKCKGTLVACDDVNDCTSDSCDPASGCVFTKLAQGKCDDGDICTTEKCEAGVCVSKPLVCEDGNPCTNDSCDQTAGGCVSTDAPAGSPCDDGNPCTMSDACSGGKCTSGQPVKCDDANACTNDACDKVSGQCVHTPSGLTTCDDNDKCTQDDACTYSVAEGKQVCAGKPLDCNDGNPCTSDQCDPKVGCTHLTNNGVCNDANPCTTDDVCKAGTCAGKAIQCDDENVCTKDYCHPIFGCMYEYVSGIACDDGNACTKNDSCMGGACTGGVYLQCNDGNDCTSDSCNPNIGCVFTKVSNGAACIDGNACTTDEKCQDGKCLPGQTVNCNDGNSCTVDACDTQTGKCAHAPLPNYTVCDDGNGCTSGDYCYKGECTGPVYNLCDDKNPCTVDTCSPTNGKCYNTPIKDCTQ